MSTLRITVLVKPCRALCQIIPHHCAPAFCLPASLNRFRHAEMTVSAACHPGSDIVWLPHKLLCWNSRCAEFQLVRLHVICHLSSVICYPSSVTRHSPFDTSNSQAVCQHLSGFNFGIRLSPHQLLLQDLRRTNSQLLCLLQKACLSDTLTAAQTTLQM